MVAHPKMGDGLIQWGTLLLPCSDTSSVGTTLLSPHGFSIGMVVPQSGDGAWEKDPCAAPWMESRQQNGAHRRKADFDTVRVHLCSGTGETKRIGSTTSCSWVCKGTGASSWGAGTGILSLGDYQSPGGGRDKFSGFCFPALCLSPPVPNVFILFLLLPMAFSSCLWTWGFCGLKMEMQTLAQKGRKGCFATQQGEGWGLLHKAEAILEQLPVAWKHLCDSVHWERQCKYLFKYGYYISHHLILQFLFTKPKEV